MEPISKDTPEMKTPTLSLKNSFDMKFDHGHLNNTDTFFCPIGDLITGVHTVYPYLEVVVHVHEKGALYRGEDPLFVHRVLNLF